MTFARPLRFSLAALLFPSAAHAQEMAPPWFEFYDKIYPEWKVQQYDTPSRAGTRVGNMGTLRNNRDVLTSNATEKEDFHDHEWSNSYVGVRGSWIAGGLTLGYDLQALVDLQGEYTSLWSNFRENFDTRDAFVYVDHPRVGRLAGGKMDSIYKEWGDRGRMFGITSGNFISTSRLLSGVGWRASGGTSFHNRRSHTLAWFGPVWSGWEVGVTHSYDDMRDGPGGPGTKLTAAAVRWREGPWYASVQTEVHRNWLPMSLGAVAPAATSILNNDATTDSRDQAWRFSWAWTEGVWKVTGDFSRLRYAEHDRRGLPGKFRSYHNLTGQLTAEYKINQTWRIAANHVNATAGSCELSGGFSCSTHGLGGYQTGGGVFYAINRSTGLFALAASTRNEDASRLGSAPQGASIASWAVGIKHQID